MMILVGLFSLPPLLSVQASSSNSTPCIIILKHREGLKLGQWPLEKQRTFALSFIHSVSTTPVIDYYRLESSQIIQVGERFEHHGAGLPSSESEGTLWQNKQGYFWLSMLRPIKKLIVRTDIEYQNKLYLGRHFNPDITEDLTKQNVINLNQWDNTALEIVIKPCSNIPK